MGGVGRTLITLGVLVMLFAGFQLYGTGILEAQAQEALTSEFDAKLATLEAAGLITTSPETDSAASDAVSDDNSETAADPDEISEMQDGINLANRPKLGEPGGPAFEVNPIEPAALTEEQLALLTPLPGEVLGEIEIPRMGLKRKLISGTRRGDLRKGPGLYEGSPLPGQPGNASIAGHRTTYGQPFVDLDLMQPGDLIKITTLQGESFYEVMPQIDEDGNELGYFIVRPDQVEVLDDYGDNRLTLTACHPKRSSRLRIIVQAQLVSAPQPVLPQLSPEQQQERTEIVAADDIPAEDAGELALDIENVVGVEENALEASLGWNLAERTPTLLWGGATVAVALLAILLGRLWKKLPTYIAASPAILFLLFFTFVHLDRMLPAL